VLLVRVDHLVVVQVAHLVDVVVGAGAGGTTGKWHIALRFAEREFRLRVKLFEAVLRVHTGLGVACHRRFQEVRLARVSMDFRAGDFVVVLLNAVAVEARSRRGPRAISALDHLLVRAAYRVRQFLEGPVRSCVVLARARFCAHFEGRSRDATGEQF